MNARGSAVVEAGFASAAVTSITAVALCAGYALGSRAYLEYQSEQAIYCLSEGRPTGLCRDQFRKRVARTLPFGRLREVALASDDGRWRIGFTWRFLDFDFRVNKWLTCRRIVGRAAS